MTDDGTPLDRARRRLRRSYVEGLFTKIQALDALRGELHVSEQDAATRLRRLAHQLVGSGGSYGFPQISETARALEQAPVQNLGEAIDALVAVLRTTVDHSAELPQSRILLIEDDADLAALFVAQLTSEHRLLDVRTSVADAERALDTGAYDLIILDVVLPDGDGRNLLAAIRERGATADIPVFVMSAVGDTRTQAECYALGAEQCFRKPIEASELIAAVSRRLSQLRREEAQVLVDPLTNLLNRTGLQRAYAREIASCQRRLEPLALVFFDVDDFKRINDEQGHQAGDQALARIASTLYERLRRNDVAARWGGDEFVVLMPGCTRQAAAGALDKIRAALATPSADGPSVKLTGGVVDAAPGVALDDCIALADELLSQGKRAGGDRLVSRPQTERPRVLHVEDDLDTLAHVRQLLRSQQLAVVGVVDAAAALEQLGLTKFQLVVLDRSLCGDQDGFALLEAIRARGPKPPVLMLTSVGDDEEIARAFALGADDYVQKPYGSRELLARIRRLLWANSAGR